MSNSPIKDALFRLAGEELVQISSRKGTYVNKITKEDIAEIEELRTMLEIGAAEITIKNITNEQIEKLEAIYMEAHFPKEEIEYSHFMEIDSKFHIELINITKNKRLINTYKHLNAHMQIVRFLFVRNRKGPLPWTQEDHLKILEALKHRDLEKLKVAIRNHIVRAGNAFLKI